MFNNPPPSNDPLPAYAPKAHVRMEFARRLQAAMIRKKWNQSELARQAALFSADKKFGRDLVSGYIRGRILPSPVHLDCLCQALGMRTDELMPAGGLPRAGEDLAPPLKMQDVGNNRVLLQINQVVDLPIALKVLTLIQGSNGGG